MSNFRVEQSDDPRRAMSVQNPMSINDLMVRQQASSTARRAPVSPNLPPPSANVRFSDAPGDSRRGRPERSSRGDRGDRGGGRGMEDEQTNGADDELGYELILNKNKMKKDEPSGSQRPEDDEIWADNGGGIGDDFVDPRERAAFEHTGGGGSGGQDLPPASSPFSRGDAGGRRDATPPPRGPAYSPAPFNRGPYSPLGGGGYDLTPKPSYEELLEKRTKVIEGLDKFRRRGLDVRTFPPDAPLEEMEMEYNRHKRAVDVEASIQFSRKMLMACVTGLEYLNARYDPLGLQLEGWSESVIEDIHNYDDVFERLYDKYHSTAQMPPEFELLLMVAGSAFMFHLTNSMFKSSMPGVGNPDMMKSVRRGVMGAMSGAMSGAANGGGVSGMMSGMFGGGKGGGANRGTGGGGGGPTSMGNNPKRAGPPPPQHPRSAGRREMRGPSGNIDDMLSNLMEREPAEVSSRLVEEIDDILNNPSDDDRDSPARSMSIRTGPAAPPLDI